MGNPDVPDGFTKCGTRSHVITVYRDFDALTDYKLCNRQSGLCLDVAGNSTAEGAAFDQLAYTSLPRLKFRIPKIGPFYYSFKVQSTGKIVSLASSTYPETNLPPDETDDRGKHQRVPGLVRLAHRRRLLPHLLGPDLPLPERGQQHQRRARPGPPLHQLRPEHGVDHPGR